DECRFSLQQSPRGIEDSVRRWDFSAENRLSRQDNRSFSPAHTRQYVSSIFLLSRQPSFHVHLNGAAQNPCSTRTTLALAAAKGNLDAVSLCQIQQCAPGGNLANFFRVKKHDSLDCTDVRRTRLSGRFALPKTFLKDPVLSYAESQKNVAGVVHESSGATEKESR